MAMTLRLTEAQDRALTLLAQAQGTSKQEAATRAIVATAARVLADAEVAELARTVVSGYAATERRLRHGR
ncbi:CopG family transcriptional regulator [Corynebacterium pygosceleis]|uniref:CopG family transcriptional regulator n=1 Tax=Corynebacterium pygosceleis TaxID=2800406 RepID=A0A9Q4C7M9_9CORY|nr:CopG family transcriptional regulator [Corynebacterium pygosceleis]MCK7637226.1 CopG family transcriptional regulator [Corynebacterium pygosceleis]MCK7676163.1 CopG family transcriptional regulator [Corynebacterium pygosceleis]MCL0119999.1 CopG family transcriptional regulator [Corynebacterium pygosceleis]MCX7445129.1 CopG family transcriptional regulator [Corynebacterium pygosceleis]MCX7468446.1 CopG family transcriptional regulator [Corynebacterium pygosceleis]